MGNTTSPARLLKIVLVTVICFFVVMTIVPNIVYRIKIQNRNNEISREIEGKSSGPAKVFPKSRSERASILEAISLRPSRVPGGSFSVSQRAIFPEPVREILADEKAVPVVYVGEEFMLRINTFSNPAISVSGDAVQNLNQVQRAGLFWAAFFRAIKPGDVEVTVTSVLPCEKSPLHESKDATVVKSYKIQARYFDESLCKWGNPQKLDRGLYWAEKSIRLLEHEARPFNKLRRLSIRVVKGDIIEVRHPYTESNGRFRGYVVVVFDNNKKFKTFAIIKIEDLDNRSLKSYFPVFAPFPKERLVAASMPPFSTPVSSVHPANGSLAGAQRNLASGGQTVNRIISDNTNSDDRGVSKAPRAIKPSTRLERIAAVFVGLCGLLFLVFSIYRSLRNKKTDLEQIPYPRIFPKKDDTQQNFGIQKEKTGKPLIFLGIIDGMIGILGAIAVLCGLALIASLFWGSEHEGSTAGFEALGTLFHAAFWIAFGVPALAGISISKHALRGSSKAKHLNLYVLVPCLFLTSALFFLSRRIFFAILKMFGFNFIGFISMILSPSLMAILILFALNFHASATMSDSSVEKDEFFLRKMQKFWVGVLAVLFLANAFPYTHSWLTEFLPFWSQSIQRSVFRFYWIIDRMVWLGIISALIVAGIGLLFYFRWARVLTLSLLLFFTFGTVVALVLHLSCKVFEMVPLLVFFIVRNVAFCVFLTNSKTKQLFK